MSSHSDAAIPTTTPYLCGGALGCFCDASLAIAAEFRAAGTPVARRAGQLILSEGDVAGDLYLLQHGIAKLCHSAASGREHILRLMGPGTILGEPSTHPTRALSVSVEAVTDVRLLHLPRKRVHWLLERRPALALHLLEAFSCELSYARRKTRDLALKDASTRLASLLLGLSRSNRSGEAAPLMRYRRSDLAAMIGVTTETVVRALASLRARRIIASRGRGLAIIDRERLRRLAFKDELDSSAQGGRGVDSDPVAEARQPSQSHDLKAAG
jgi:CRP/FNR family transcriptional regulator